MQHFTLHKALELLLVLLPLYLTFEAPRAVLHVLQKRAASHVGLCDVVAGVEGRLDTASGCLHQVVKDKLAHQALQCRLLPVANTAPLSCASTRNDVVGKPSGTTAEYASGSHGEKIVEVGGSCLALLRCP